MALGLGDSFSPRLFTELPWRGLVGLTGFPGRPDLLFLLWRIVGLDGIRHFL